MIDVHCHLNFKAFAKDYDEVIKRAIKAGVTKIINVGTKLDSSKRAVELAEEYENLYAIVGVHPHHADKIGKFYPERSASWRRVEGSPKDWINELEQLAKSSKKIVAIGEIGLDNYRYQSNGIVDLQTQKEVFVKQIELAHRLKLPLQIHNRRAGNDILNVLRNHTSYLLNPPGMFHCMSGDIELLKKVLDMGFYVGFDGNITYKGLAPGETVELKELVKYAPMERILTETDSPYLTPQPHRGSKNIPSYVILVGEFIAQTKGISYQIVKEQTTQNANELFTLEARR